MPESNENNQEYPLRRFIFRIAIPLMTVALIVIAARTIARHWFVEENVRPVEDTGTYNPPALNLAFTDVDGTDTYSEEAKSKLIAAASQLLSATGESQPSDENSEKVKAAIEKLETADASNWSERREALQNALRQYAKSLEVK